MSDQIVLQFSTTENSLSNYASWIIRHLSHSPFSHCDVLLPDGNLLGASDSPKAPVISGNPRGVAIRPPNYQAYGRRCRMVVETPLAEKIREKGLSQLGKPFDHSALYGFLSDAPPGKRNWRESSSWYCAELCVWSFEAAGYWCPSLSVWPKNRISPSDLLMIFLFDPRWSNRETFWESDQ